MEFKSQAIDASNRLKIVDAIRQWHFECQSCVHNTRDVHETFQPETETETKTFSPETETRPRRDVGRSRDRLETRHPRPRPCTSLHDNLINTIKYAY